MKFYESPELKRLAEETVKVCFEKACEYYGIVGKSVPSVKLKSDMKRVAGTANIMQNLITLNEILFKENVDEFVKEIIPHEVSHIIQRIVYPRAKQNHGPEFKRVMRNVFGLAGNTYHKMDCSNKELNIREKKSYTIRIQVRMWKIFVSDCKETPSTFAVFKCIQTRLFTKQVRKT